MTRLEALLLAHEACQRAAPLEAVGLLARTRHRWFHWLLPSLTRSRTTFAVPDSAWLAALKEADAKGARALCLYHSHPTGPAHLSAVDLRTLAPAGTPITPWLALFSPEGLMLYRWKAGHFRPLPAANAFFTNSAVRRFKF